MLNVLVINALVIASLMLTMWLISLPLKDVSIVDIAWGLGFVVVAWVSHLLGSVSGSGLVIPVLTTVWGLRLSGYLLLRRIGAPEDFRYRNMRSAHPFSFPVRSLLTIFSLQGVLMWIVAMPLQTVSRPLIPPYVVALIGLLLWVTGFVFESVGDWQLARFKSDPSNDGRLMNHGLWRYTRHPNYFGDFLVWWGLFFLALSAGAPWWSVVGPVLLSVLLLRVSGVTLLEKSLRNRKEGYADYVARTNAFFPWRPRQA